APITGGEFAWAARDGELHICGVLDGKEKRKLSIEHPLTRIVALRERESQIAQGVGTTRTNRLNAAAETLKKERENARQTAQTLEKTRTESRAKREEADAAAEAQRLSPDDKGLQETSKKAEETARKSEAALRAAKVNAELGARLAGDAAE